MQGYILRVFFKCFLCLLFIFAFSSTAMAFKGHKDAYKKYRGLITFEYDEDENATSAMSELHHPHFILKRPNGKNSEFMLSASVSIDGPTTDPSKARVSLIFSTISSMDWKYMKCHDLQMVVDGKRLDLPPASHDGDVEMPLIYEYVEVDLDLATYLKIATGSKVEGRICNEKFVFSNKHNWLMLEVLRLVCPNALANAKIDFDTNTFRAPAQK